MAHTLKAADAEFGSSPTYWYGLLTIAIHNQPVAEDIIRRILSHQSPTKKLDLRQLAKTLHEARMKECYGNMPHNQPWPDKLPGDFGYVPQPWVDVAWAQAKVVAKLIGDS